MPRCIAVIMAGGAGTRFWPLSTEARPKQFLQLTGERTMLQLSYDRARGMLPPERILVLTAEPYLDLVRQQLPELPPDNAVGEPCRRDTAAAVCLGALLAQRIDPEAVMVILTADHWIHPVPELHRAIESAALGAEHTGALYTFGIKPTYPATGYGYLELGEPLPAEQGLEHFQLAAFREKPDLATATRYVESGGYAWNSGMFIWRVRDILAQFARHLPEHPRALEPVLDRFGTPDFAPALNRSFAKLQKISIDYAILEKAERVHAVLPHFDWSDVGGWAALREFLSTDDHENAFRGRLATLGSRRNLVYCEDPHELLALVGASNLAVVRSGSKTLIADLDHLEQIKNLVEALELEDR